MLGFHFKVKSPFLASQKIKYPAISHGFFGLMFQDGIAVVSWVTNLICSMTLNGNYFSH